MLSSRVLRIAGIVLLAWIIFQIIQKKNEAAAKLANPVQIRNEEGELVDRPVEDDTVMLLPWYAGAAIIAGLLVVTWLVPMFGEAVGTSAFGSGEEALPDPYLKARGKVAIGDYEGAISFFEQAAAENPEDRRAYSDIINLCVDKLRDPARAVQVAEKALEKEWSDDDQAYFLFKLADLHGEHGEGQDRVVQILQDVIQRFPESRHSANAIHRLREIDPSLIPLPGAFSPPSPGGPASPSVPNPNA